MKGIHIQVRGGYCGQFVEFELAGVDRKKVIEATAERLPGPARAELRRQIGAMVERDDVVMAAAMSGEDYSFIARATPCEVVS